MQVQKKNLPNMSMSGRCQKAVEQADRYWLGNVWPSHSEALNQKTPLLNASAWVTFPHSVTVLDNKLMSATSWNFLKTSSNIPSFTVLLAVLFLSSFPYKDLSSSCEKRPFCPYEDRFLSFSPNMKNVRTNLWPYVSQCCSKLQLSGDSMFHEFYVGAKIN